VLDLEAGGVMNTKMNTKIYTGLGRGSVIPYVQCGCMFPLLILVSSIKEVIMGKIASWGVLREVSALLPLCILDHILYTIGRERLVAPLFAMSEGS
jgi:hypothetical protein